MKHLKGKTALVTGAAKGLGQSIAMHLADCGVQIAAQYLHSSEDAKKTLTYIKKKSSGCLIQADLTKKGEVEQMVKKATDEIGSIDILINVVGNFIYTPITDTTYEAFTDVIDTNLSSVFLTCQLVLPQMKKRGFGRIINFGCVAADSLTIREKTTPYYIAKTGVIMLTKVFAYEHAADGITINSISPGILESSIAKPPTPSNNFVQFRDIIHGVDMILDPASSSLNGSNIEIAQGWRPGYST